MDSPENPAILAQMDETRPETRVFVRRRAFAFTKEALAALTPTAKVVEYSDTEHEGLRYRLLPSGAARFSAILRVTGANGVKKQRRFEIGPADMVSLEQAIERWEQIKSDLASDIHVRTAPRTIRTINQLCSAFVAALREDPATSKSARHEVPMLIARHVQDRVGHHPVNWLTEETVSDLLHSAKVPLPKTAASPVAARKDQLTQPTLTGGMDRLYFALKRLCRWAKKKRILADNPMEELRYRKRAQERERALTLSEIAALWRGLDHGYYDDDRKLRQVNQPFNTIIRLLLLLGRRSAEVSQARIAEFKLADSIWQLPAARTKTSASLQIQLPPLALSLIEDAIKAAGNSAYLFPACRKRGKRGVDRPVYERSVNKAAEPLFACIDHDLRIHDLRRTFATQLGEASIDPFVIERALGHSLGKNYNRFDYAQKVGQALYLLQDKILGIAKAAPAEPLAGPLTKRKARRA